MIQVLRQNSLKLMVNSQRRKSDYRSIKREFRRMKTINTLSPEFTGEQNVHGWLDQKKIRQLAKIYEDRRNKHSLTVKIDDKDKDLYKKFFNEISEQEDQYFLKKFDEVIDNCNSELETLPFSIKQEIRNLTKMQKDPQAVRLEPFTLYYDQIMRLYPEEQAIILLVGNRIQKIATDKLPQGE